MAFQKIKVANPIVEMDGIRSIFSLFFFSLLSFFFFVKKKTKHKNLLVIWFRSDYFYA